MLMVPSTKAKTVADVLAELGDISPYRVRLRPYPAKVADVVRIQEREKRLFELVDGFLVEKVMGHPESRVASALIAALENYLETNDLGVVSGEGGMFRLPGNLVRIPDVAFVPWQSFPNDEALVESVPEVIPGLAVEVLSQSNTPGEMSRKLREYFRAGVRLVWFVDLVKETVTAFTSEERSKVISSAGKLDGGKVLPGFELSVAKIFAKLKRSRKPKRSGR